MGREERTHGIEEKQTHQTLTKFPSAAGKEVGVENRILWREESKVRIGHLPSPWSTRYFSLLHTGLN